MKVGGVCEQRPKRNQGRMTVLRTLCLFSSRSIVHAWGSSTSSYVPLLRVPPPSSLPTVFPPGDPTDRSLLSPRSLSILVLLENVVPPPGFFNFMGFFWRDRERERKREGERDRYEYFFSFFFFLIISFILFLFSSNSLWCFFFAIEKDSLEIDFFPSFILVSKGRVTLRNLFFFYFCKEYFPFPRKFHEIKALQPSYSFQWKVIFFFPFPFSFSFISTLSDDLSNSRVINALAVFRSLLFSKHVFHEVSVYFIFRIRA